MTKFIWSIDSDNFIHSSCISDKMTVREFMVKICKRLKQYSETYSLEALKSGKIAHCHVHDNTRANKQTEEYKKLFGQLKKVNEILAQERCQIEPEDILQLAFPNISDKFRGFGYILDNVFYLIYLDPYHKVYKK